MPSEESPMSLKLGGDFSTDLLDQIILRYRQNIELATSLVNWASVHLLARELERCWKSNNQILICGNGGSGANAEHIANDLLYGISKKMGVGIRSKALTANSAVLSCLANDEGYDNVFAYQLAVDAKDEDILLVLSGSGNSPNILNVIKEAQRRNIKTFGILGYQGGRAKDMLDVAIHTPINDMQVSEDIQMIILHTLSQWLFESYTDIQS